MCDTASIETNEELQRLRERVRELERLTILQAEEIRLMKLREHGRSSEKLSPEDIRQGSLFDEAELYSVAESVDAPTEVVRVTKTVYTRRKRGRKPIDPKLSRIEVVVDLTEAEKAVGDGFELVRIGEETSEQVHEVPQKYIVIRTVRPKYVVRRAYVAADDDDQIASEIRVAPMPPHILPRSIATPSLLASIITAKFCDGLPFYRQERMFARHGLEISRQDMANWSIAVAKKLEALEGLLRKELLASPYLHCDETFFQVMDEPGRANSTQSYMWVTTGGVGDRRVVLYQYSRTRSSAFISTFLDSYTGFLQTDGYDGYNAIGEKDGVVHVGCWAHARRKFIDALKVSGGEGSAGTLIAMIGSLYEIENRLRAAFVQPDGTGDQDAFAKERRKDTAPIFAQIESWLVTAK